MFHTFIGITFELINIGNINIRSIEVAISGLPYFAAGFVCFIVNLTAIGYFQSIENVKAATVFALLRGFVFLIPVFLIMPQLFGVMGIWLAMPVSEILTTVVIGFYYTAGRRKYKTDTFSQPITDKA